jgi:hypothetical protein
MSFTLDDLERLVQDMPASSGNLEELLLPLTRDFVREQYAKDDCIAQIFKPEKVTDDVDCTGDGPHLHRESS